jgi:hypothetical protein
MSQGPAEADSSSASREIFPYFVEHAGSLPFFLCFVDRAYWYNRVEKNQLDAQLILGIFSQPLNMFSAYLDPSSGGRTVCIQQLVHTVLFR